MPETSHVWIRQNALWLRLLTTVLILGALVLIFIVEITPDIVSYTIRRAETDQPTIVQLNAEISTERQLGKKLLAALDSTNANEHTLRSDQVVLTTIQDCSRRRGVTITGYDRATSTRNTRSQAPSYRLLVEGRFGDLAMFLSDLESLPPGLTVRSLSMESKVLGQDFVRGAVVVESGD